MKWEIQEAPCSSYCVFGWVDAAVDGLKKHFGKGLSIHVYIGKKGKGYEYFLREDLIETGKHIIEQFKDKKFRKEIRDSWKGFKKTMDALFGKIMQGKHHDLSIEELEKLYHVFNAAYAEYYDLMMFAEPVELVLDGFFKDSIKKLKEDFSILTTPPELSFIQKEKLSVIKLIEHIGKDAIISGLNADQKRALHEHIHQFAWLRSSYLETPTLSEQDVLDRAKELVQNEVVEREKKKILGFEKDITQKKESIISKSKLSPETVEMIHISDFTGILHDERKEYTLKWLYYCALLLEEIGKRFKYSLHDMFFSSKIEIERLFKEKKLDPQKIKEGFDAFTYIREPGKSTEYYGKDTLGYEKQFMHEVDTDVSTIHGMPVSGGIAVGKVKIIHLTSQFPKFNEGDILVAPMTRPDYVPLMGRAAAIVTDQGGITSHAAIVSRELGKPCVVGTKTATKVLKDDDMVEVNANHGWIRIIK